MNLSFEFYDLPHEIKHIIFHKNRDKTRTKRDIVNLLETFFGEPIEHFSSNPKDFAKNGIVERFNRTMRRRVEGFMKKQRGTRGNWMGQVPTIMVKYNSRRHGTT